MAYSRQTVSSFPYYVWQQQKDHQGNVNFTVDTPPASRTIVYLGTRSGSAVVGYRAKMRDGVSASSAYTLDSSKLEKLISADFADTFQSWNSTKRVWDPWLSFSMKGNFGSPPTSPEAHLTVSTSAAEAMALARIHKAIQAEFQHLNSLSVLAEAVDVLRMFTRPFSAIVDLTNSHLNRLIKERRRLSGNSAMIEKSWADIVASTYLEYAFGLVPLISDTRAIAEAVAKFEDASFIPHSRVRGRGIDTAVSPTISFAGLADGKTMAKISRIKTTEARAQYIVGIRTSLICDYRSNDRLLQILGFDPLNFIPAVWEAVPWSWLIDYFTNVSDILNAFATSSSTVCWINKTWVTKTTIRQTAMFDLAETKRILAFSGNVRVSSFHGSALGGWQYIRTTLTRSVPTTLGVPDFTLNFPFSVQKWINMAAVLISRRGPTAALAA